MEVRPEVVGAVLVGGDSRRMGEDKALLQFEGGSLAERACRVLSSRLDRVVVVSRCRGDHSDLGVEEIADRLAGYGPLGGIDAALAHAAGRQVFALACDLPRVSPDLVDLLLAEAAEADLSVPGAVVPVLAGRAQPLCAVYSAACGPSLETYLRSGGRRVLSYLEKVTVRQVELGPAQPFFRPDLLDNVNRPDEARQLGIELPTVDA